MAEACRIHARDLKLTDKIVPDGKQSGDVIKAISRQPGPRSIRVEGARSGTWNLRPDELVTVKRDDCG